MAEQWVVVGTDNFAHDDYPVAIRADRDEALAVAADRARQPNGSLPDTYHAYPMSAAQHRTGLASSQIQQLVEILDG